MCMTLILCLSLTHIQITHHRSTCLSAHASAPLHPYTLSIRSTNQFFLDVPRFSTEFGKNNRLVTSLLQSGMDYLLISDSRPLSWLENGANKLATRLL